jgi:S1-C subfamily serine protease
MRKWLIPTLVFLALLCAATAHQFAAPISETFVIEPSPSAPPPTTLREYQEINLNLIRRIRCVSADGIGGTGTAWFISEDTLATAAHVVHGFGAVCYDLDNKFPVVVEHLDEDNDFAIVRMPVGSLPAYISYSCEGFNAGELYFATGWAGGSELMQTHVRALRVRSSADSYSSSSPRRRMEALRFLEGNLYRGMSGGPVFDDHGFAIGINSATDDDGTGFSRSLKDTILCGSPRKNTVLADEPQAPSSVS